MEHVWLLAITKGAEDIAISRVRLQETLIHTNQVSASIDRRGHSDREFSFGSQKICDKKVFIYGRTQITEFLWTYQKTSEAQPHRVLVYRVVLKLGGMEMSGEIVVTESHHIDFVYFWQESVMA